MKELGRGIFILIVLAFFGCGAAPADSPESNAQTSGAEVVAPGVGSMAPAFELAGSDGKTHRLADYVGEHVVLAFFPKAFTAG